MASSDPNERERLRLLSLYEDVQSDDEVEEIDDLNDNVDSETDECEELDHNSETEQEDDDDAEKPTELPPESSSKTSPSKKGSQRHLFYVGKDKITKWRKHQYPQNVRTRSQNVIYHLPGTKGNARQASSLCSAFINLLMMLV